MSDIDDKWISPSEELTNAVALECLRVAIKLIAPAAKQYTEDAKCMHHVVAAAILRSFVEMRKLEIKAKKQLQIQHKTKNVDNLYLDQPHIIATALMAVASGNTEAGDWHPYSRMSQLLPIYGAVCAALEGAVKLDFLLQDDLGIELLWSDQWADTVLRLMPIPRKV